MGPGLPFPCLAEAARHWGTPALISYQLPTTRYFIFPINLWVMRLYTYILTALSPSASAV